MFGLVTFSVTAIENVDGTYEMALVDFYNGETNTSIIHLKNILKFKHNHTPARLLLVQAYLELGNGIAAELELKKTETTQVDDNRVVSLFAHAYLLQKQYEKVIEISESELHQGDIEHEILLYRGQAFIGLKQYRSADLAFKQALLSQPNSQVALLGRAQIALNDLKPLLALNYIEQSIQVDKPFINGWILKAKILQQMQRSQEALQAIDEALVLNSKHMSARLTKAMLLIMSKEYQQAETHVDFILKNIANEPRAGYLKAIILASKVNKSSKIDNNKLAEVIVTLSVVPEEVMRNTPDYYYLAGQTNYQFGNLDDAKRYLTKFLTYSAHEINSVLMIATIDLRQEQPEAACSLLMKTNIARPNDLRILTLLGLAYLQLNNTNKAEFYFESVLKERPNSTFALTNLAKSKMKSGDYDSAIDALLSIENPKINSSEIKLLLIDSYQKSKKLNKAILVAEELIAKDPDNSFYHQRLGALYGLNKNLLLARASFNNALALDENNILAIMHLARMDNIAGNSEKGLQFLQRKLKQFPLDVLLMAEISDSYLFVGEQANSLLWIKKASALAQNNFYIINKLVAALVKSKQMKEALAINEAFIIRNRKELAAVKLQASLYQKNNEHAKAVDILKYFVEKSDNKAFAYIKLAKAQLLAQNRSAAIQSYKKAIIADNTLLVAYLGLVDLIIKNRDEAYALLLIATVKTLSESESLAEQLKGDLYFQLEQQSLAKQYYLKSIAITPEKGALLGLYQSYKKLDEVEKAIPYLLTWLNSHPQDLQVKISLADSYRYSHQLEKSASFYQELLTEYGQLPILLNNMANVNYALGNKDKARDYAEQAYSYLNHNVAIIDTLAWIECRLGNHKRALALFRKALAKDYDNAEVKYHIAITLDALNRKKEAKDFLMQAVASTQNFPEKSSAASLLLTWKNKSS